MIKVIFGTNMKRRDTIVDAGTTLKAFCSKYNLPYESKLMMLDGITLSAGDINKTFAEMNVTEECIFITAPKQDNA